MGKECYQCHRMKSKLNNKSRCLTCVTQANEFNIEENARLRFELAELSLIREKEAGNIQKAIARAEELEEIVKAVAHIGVDFGYGKLEIGQDEIEKARLLIGNQA